MLTDHQTYSQPNYWQCSYIHFYYYFSMEF